MNPRRGADACACGCSGKAVVKLRGGGQSEERSGGGFKSVVDVAKHRPEGAARKRPSANGEWAEARYVFKLRDAEPLNGSSSLAEA